MRDLPYKHLALVPLLLFLFSVLVRPALAVEKLLATDGQSEIVLPQGWEKITDLNDKAEIEVGSRRSQEYMIVLTENKSDFVEMNLEKYCEQGRKPLLDGLKDATASPFLKSTVDSSPALQSEFRGAHGNLKIAYLYTCVEGRQNFFQLVTWTVNSHYDSSKPTFDALIDSFHETQVVAK